MMHLVFPPLDGQPHWYADPGVHRIARAIFVNRQAVSIDYLPAFASFCQPPVTFLGIEKPQIYQNTPTAQANDCLDVWGAACWFRSRVQHAASVIERIVSPEEWKGQLPKPVHHARLWEAMTESERALFPTDTEERIRKGIQRGGYTNAKGNDFHNLLDAVGIGLFCECRTGRAGVMIRI